MKKYIPTIYPTCIQGSTKTFIFSSLQGGWEGDLGLDLSKSIPFNMMNAFDKQESFLQYTDAHISK